MEIIIELHDGIPCDPMVFLNEDDAGAMFEEIVSKSGFREKNNKESWGHYVEKFMEWEQSDGCSYDTNEYEIHWWTGMEVSTREKK